MLLAGAANGARADVAAPAPSCAPSSPAGTVSLSASDYTVSEHAGSLTVTIQRTHTSGCEWVYYSVGPETAIPGVDFDTVPNTQVLFEPGQDSYSFQVPVIDTGMSAPPVYAAVYLFGSLPDTIATSKDVISGVAIPGRHLRPDVKVAGPSCRTCRVARAVARPRGRKIQLKAPTTLTDVFDGSEVGSCSCCKEGG